jgi:hypothetical protein
MKQIRIIRDGYGKVTFEAVSIDATENVFFTNLDPQAAHWPELSSNQLGPPPSPNSSQTPVPSSDGRAAPYQVVYGCRISGHEGEQGIIRVFPPLTAARHTSLAAATVGKAIAEQQLVSGGMAPYAISGQVFQVSDGTNSVIRSGAGIGPALELNAKTSELGITVTGTPTVAGTYRFTLTVNDALGGNLQQAQYSMLVKTAAT